MEARRIMVAVDFGATSERALETAIDLAQKLGARLDLVNVCPPIPIEARDQAAPPYVEDAYERLAALRARAEARGVPTETHLRTDTIVFGLLEAIEELDPQLVVVGSHGRRGVARVLLGSISESIARRSAVPVVIVPSPERRRMAEEAAWSCQSCGHILAGGESAAMCAQCGERPARWISAPIAAGPADAGERAVGQGVAEDMAPIATQDPATLFATTPAGTEGTEPNAEIRIRRF